MRTAGYYLVLFGTIIPDPFTRWKIMPFIETFIPYFVWSIPLIWEVYKFMGIASLSLSGWWWYPHCRCSCWSSWSWYDPTVDEEHVCNHVVGTFCKHNWSLTAARAAPGAKLTTDAIINVLKLGIANNSSMHEEKFLWSRLVRRRAPFWRIASC